MKDLKFEEEIQKLQNVVDKLEKGDLTLEESIEWFKKGIELSKWCTEKLDEIEREVTVLTENGEVEV